MATTRAKESCGLGKERKISVSIPNTQTKRTPKSSPRGISTDQKLSSFTSSSSSSSSSTHSLSILPQKHVPNYLKSTASSRHDHNFKPLKKSAAPPAPIPEPKPSVNRRRSFDKPPPAAPRLDKPFRSPGPRNRAAAHVSIRSSSFGAKPSTTISSSTKSGVLERSASKNSKLGGKSQQPIQTLKSSSNVRKNLKRESSNAASSSAEIVPKTKNGVEHVDQSPVVALGANQEELKKIECKLDPYLPDPKPEIDKELRDVGEKKLYHHQPIQDTKMFKVDETREAAETETSRAGNAKLSIRVEENREQKDGEGGGEEEEAKEEEKTERIAVEKEEGGEEVIVSDQKEAEEAAEKATGGKPRQGGAGRKESAAVYNHVIEETASKLLEKRKNKVRALAGAFQTVIDYESSSK